MKNNKNKIELDNDTQTMSYKRGGRKSKRRIAGTEGSSESVMQPRPPSQTPEQNGKMLHEYT